MIYYRLPVDGHGEWMPVWHRKQGCVHLRKRPRRPAPELIAVDTALVGAKPLVGEFCKHCCGDR